MTAIAALLGLICAMAIGVLGLVGAAAIGLLSWIADAVYEALGGEL